MRRSASLLPLVAALLSTVIVIACGDSSPTRPSALPHRQAVDSRPEANGLSPGVDDPEAESAPDTDAFATALDALAGAGRNSYRGALGPSGAGIAADDWFLDILRAPKTGTSFKVNRLGMFPQPAPKFRFEITAPMNIPQTAFLIFFLTSGGRECGVAAAKSFFPLTANVPRKVDIPNNYIIVGPEACFLEGQKCTPTQCKFPLTTNRMHIFFGHRDQGVAQGKESYKYTWKR